MSLAAIGPVLLLFLALIATGEVARRIRILQRFAVLGALGRRSAAVLARRGVSDHSKERATRILSGRMMKASLAAGGALMVVIAPVLIVLAADIVLPFGVRAAFLDWQARLILLSLMVVYVLVRWQFGKRLQPR